MIKQDLYKNRRLYNVYGLTLTEWNKKFKEQKGVCWICQKLPPSGRLCVDHRHVKNYKKLDPESKKLEVRGLLCFLCNTMLGKLEKRRNARFLLEQMYKYFQHYKIFGE